MSSSFNKSPNIGGDRGMIVTISAVSINKSIIIETTICCILSWIDGLVTMLQRLLSKRRDYIPKEIKTQIDFLKCLNDLGKPIV